MLYRQEINGVDFAPYIREGGVQQSEVVRNQQSVVTLDGTLHTSGVVKRRIVTQLLELRDETARRLMAVLTNPATVVYTDEALGDVTRTFLVTDRTGTARTVAGGITWWQNVSYTLEEL